MNILPQNVQKLIQLLQRVPGLGPRSSARVAMFLLKSPKKYNKELGEVIRDLKKEIVYCQSCFNIASNSPCDICSNSERETSIICVVEDPLDVLAFENGTDYEGVYHVLGGVISPVNGVGPEDLTIRQLLERIRKGGVREVIIATNPDIEGEATAMYIKQELKTQNSKLKITRLARGLPSGADLEYADRTTIKRALEGRVAF